MTLSKSAALFAIAIYYSAPVCAETFGIRFIVSDDLARTSAQQLITQEKIAQYIKGLNERYRNSEVNLVAEISQIEFTKIEATDDLQILRDMQNERNGFEAMFKKSHEVHADYTIALPSQLFNKGRPSCGRAYAVNTTIEAISNPRKAFAVVNFVCGSHTLAHELGHLMGLNHGTQVGNCHPSTNQTRAIAPYANGYAEGNCDGKPQTGEFGDIMVGGYMRDIMGNDKGNLAIFSNPLLHDERCGKNKICGDPSIGDAARTLNENAHYYSGHE